MLRILHKHATERTIGTVPIVWTVRILRQWWVAIASLAVRLNLSYFPIKTVFCGPWRVQPSVVVSGEYQMSSHM